MVKKSNKKPIKGNIEVANNAKNIQTEPKSYALHALFNRDYKWYEWLVFAFLLTGIFYTYSTYSSGMYQGEEGAQYMNMKGFWNDPNSILGNWAKPGWKLIYVFPALLGFKFLYVFNSFISSLTIIITYQLVKKLGGTISLISVLMLVSQFFWFEMSFRNFSEVISALLLVLAIYLRYQNKLLLSSLILSYVIIIRQELLPIAGLYGLYLLYKREWISALLLGLFPLVINIWGWYATGDPLYILTDALGTSEGYADRYPRQGFDHYFKVSMPIFGTLACIGLLAYVFLVFSKERKLESNLLIPIILVYLIHCIFNYQGAKIGTSTGGNWRYLLVVSPLIATLASLGWDHFNESKKKVYFLILLIPFLIFIGKTNIFKHNYILFQQEKDFSLLIFSIIASLGLYFISNKNNLVYFLSGCTVLFNYFYLKPIQEGAEDKSMKLFANWVKDNKIDTSQIYLSNSMFFFFMDKNAYEFKKPTKFISKETIDSASVGSYIFWDTHYSPRSGVNYTYFSENPSKYSFVKQHVSHDSTYHLLVFKKIAM